MDWDKDFGDLVIPPSFQLEDEKPTKFKTPKNFRGQENDKAETRIDQVWLRRVQIMVEQKWYPQLETRSDYYFACLFNEGITLDGLWERKAPDLNTAPEMGMDDLVQQQEHEDALLAHCTKTLEKLSTGKNINTMRLLAFVQNISAIKLSCPEASVQFYASLDNLALTARTHIANSRLH